MSRLGPGYPNMAWSSRQALVDVHRSFTGVSGGGHDVILASASLVAITGTYFEGSGRETDTNGGRRGVGGLWAAGIGGLRHRQ